MAEVQPQSDVAMLWETALNDYTEVAKVDIRKELVAKRSVTSIMMDQQHQLETFKSFRHDKGKLDKLRTIISSNADVIQAAAKQVADAASAAFPPGSAVLTAFTFVMNASKHVSDDYDMIESFFGVMDSFLKRLSLLEGKIPPLKNFQMFLIKVFSSLLTLSGLARSYCSKGRLLKWAKALVDGNDPNLVGAYSTLNENLQRLESATIFQTLRTTIEINEKAKAIDRSVSGIQSQLDKNNVLTAQTLETTQQTLMVSMQTNSGIQELIIQSSESAIASSELLRRQAEIAKAIAKLNPNDMADKQRTLKSGASRSANLENLKAFHLWTEAEGPLYEKMVDMKLASIEQLFDWSEDDPAFLAIVDNQNPLLWISATSGMGKSTLSFKMFQKLEEKFADESTTCVAWFPFDAEQPTMCLLGNMLSCVAIRAAEKDERYCSETLTAIRRANWTLDNVNIWDHLIESRFTRESGRRLILLLDGIDELAELDLPVVIEFMKKVAAKELAVQVVFTSNPNRKEQFSILDAKCINLDRDRILGDMRILARSKMNTFSRLRKLRSSLKKIILREVLHKADSFLYIEHMMRKFNALGRETSILKELKILPQNTTGVYHALLDDCQRNRTIKDQELLRALLAWLAYGEAELTLGAANSLIKLINNENSLSIEEELDGRLSRILRLSGEQVDQTHDDDSDNEDKDDGTTQLRQDLMEISGTQNERLIFQGRSLKSFVLQGSREQHDLRCSTLDAQIIFSRTCATILTMPKASLDVGDKELLEYAAMYYLLHLSKVHPEDEAVHEEHVKAIVEGIFSVFTNKNEALKWMERNLAVASQALIPAWLTDEEVLTMLSNWAKRALRLPHGSLTSKTLEWFQVLVVEPRGTLLPIARFHIVNWFSSSDPYEANWGFMVAHSALQQARHLPELQKNTDLQDYFECYMNNRELTQYSFEVMASFFSDIVKTASSYKAIGLAMIQQQNSSLYESAINQFGKGLDQNTIDNYERYQILSHRGKTLLKLLEETDANEKRRYLLEESLKTLKEANEIYRCMDPTSRNIESIKALADLNFAATAEAAARQGDHECVLHMFREAYEMGCPLGSSTFMNVMTIVDLLAGANEFRTILALLQYIPTDNIVTLLSTNCSKIFCLGASRLNKGHYLLKLYETSWKSLETSPTGAGGLRTDLMTTAAMFAYQAMGDPEIAKSILRQALSFSTTTPWGLLEASNMLSNILFEECRQSKDPKVKQKSLDEVRSLIDKLKQVIKEDFNPAESQINITMALMLRRLGPLLEFYERLDAAFRLCLDDLRDDTSANDFDALRRLARIMGCISGFERHASIAYTAQLYIIDEGDTAENIDKEHPAKGDQTSTLSNELEISTGSQPVINGCVDKPDESEQPQILETGMNDSEAVTQISSTDQFSISPPETNLINENLVGTSARFTCNGCEAIIETWTGDPTYLCIYCIDCDICQECFTNKTAREKGEVESDWRVICPKGHKHVKGPIEGWRGLKRGVILIHDEEISVKDWLENVESHWAKYWDGFWSDMNE